jgi:hypothetical protein
MAWDGLLNRKVVVFYDDEESIKRKIGILLSITPEYVALCTEGKNIMIPLPRVLRVEEVRA